MYKLISGVTGVDMPILITELEYNRLVPGGKLFYIQVPIISCSARYEKQSVQDAEYEEIEDVEYEDVEDNLSKIVKQTYD